jgi:hypothetical protein
MAETTLAIEGDIVDVNPQALIAAAIDKGLPVETMEKLLAMRRELRAEWARDQFFKALRTFQRDCPVIVKTKVVKDRGGREMYRYAPLDSIVAQVKEKLDAHGFSYIITTAQGDGGFTATCTAHHSDGHQESTGFRVPIDPNDFMSEPQQVGSAGTFAKRYAFCNAFGIMTADSDPDAVKPEPGNGKPEAPPRDVTPPNQSGERYGQTFPAKKAEECPACGQSWAVGDQIRYHYKGEKRRLEHAQCPQSAAYTSTHAEVCALIDKLPEERRDEYRTHLANAHNMDALMALREALSIGEMNAAAAAGFDGQPS